MTNVERSNRGFASLPREKRSAIASMGGRRAHELGVAHEWDSTEARKAGRKGGSSRRNIIEEEIIPEQTILPAQDSNE